MIGIDKKRIQKYRKRLNLAALIIFILSLWLIRKYNDVSYLETDKEMLEHGHTVYVIDSKEGIDSVLGTA
jgi:hypothetical protein